jgi:hypothetical protein
MGNLRSRYSLILLSSCICVLVTVYPIISYVTIGLTPHAFWNITDFGAKCEKCETIDTMIWSR